MVAWKFQSYVKNSVSHTLLGIYIACFITNSTVLLPASSMVIVLEFAHLINPLAVAIVGALGASTGELTGYFMGRAGSNIIRSTKVKQLKKMQEKHAYLWVFIFALIPLPIFDVVGLMAGSSKMNIFGFFFTCVVGKFLKMGCYILLFQLLENMAKIII